MGLLRSKNCPWFLRPGPDMQECETPVFACTLAAPSRVWDKAWPVQVSGVAGVGGVAPGLGVWKGWSLLWELIH